MEAILDSYLHFNRTIHLRITAQRMHCNVDFFHDITDTTDNGHPQEIPESDIRPNIDFVRFLHIIEIERIACVLYEISGPSQFTDQRGELMMVTPIVVQLNLSYKLDFYSLVF